MTMGTQALAGSLIEIDVPLYHSEMALKEAILADDHRYYFQAAPGTEAMQWDAVELVLLDVARHYPQHTHLSIEGTNWLWQNRLLNHAMSFRFGEPGDLPLAPLDWLGRQVQEDLLILEGEDRFRLVAGQLCFANAWCLDDKIGRPFLDIHEEVPLFAEQLGRSSSLLMARLKPNRPVWRVNWSIRANDWLNAATRFSEADKQTKFAVTATNAGERCFLRIERQGLARLPRTNGILFTIHTYQEPIASVAAHTERAQQIAAVLQTMPREVLVYKGMAPFIEPLLAYLDASIVRA
jgi:hypothetical protein